MFDKRIIAEFVTGSRLYGMATADSDIDRRGVCLEDEIDIYGLTPFDKPYEDKDSDRVIYSLKQFADLARDSNPSIIELFYMTDNLVESARMQNIWSKIRAYRHAFISRKVTKTFVGYVISQRKRMDTHYKWMRGKAPVKPVPEDYGMIYDVDGSPRWTDTLLKNKYDNHLKDYQSYATWIENRNPERHETEVAFGFDTKHGSHIVRLLEEVDELHQYGTITFPRPEAGLLRDIRKGAWSYDQLIDWMEKKIQHIEMVADPSSCLNHKPNDKQINQLLIDIYRQELRR